jgi:hypothetical protein
VGRADPKVPRNENMAKLMSDHAGESGHNIECSLQGGFQTAFHPRQEEEKKLGGCATAIPLISTSFNDHPIGIPGEIQRAVDSAVLLHASTLEQRSRNDGPRALMIVSKSGQAPFNRYGGCREGATDQRRKRTWKAT